VRHITGQVKENLEILACRVNTLRVAGSDISARSGARSIPSASGVDRHRLLGAGHLHDAEDGQ